VRCGGCAAVSGGDEAAGGAGQEVARALVNLRFVIYDFGLGGGDCWLRHCGSGDNWLAKPSDKAAADTCERAEK